MSRLLEAIVNANQRAAQGETAGLHPADFEGSLPLVALTCIDPRLNPMMPAILGLREEHFVWLRNAGNIISGPMSSTMRSIALACAVKGGREIAIIGHTDCRVKQVSASGLLDRFKALGVDRSKLPDNLTEFFGLFASERGNVIKAVEFVRQSPLMGPAIPVHGLIVDIHTGRLEWLVNGYASTTTPLATGTIDKLAMPAFELGNMSFPEGAIGEVTSPPAPMTTIRDEPAQPALKIKRDPPPVPPRIMTDLEWKQRRRRES